MSLLKKIDLVDAAAPVPGKCAPERLIAGDPDFLTWAMETFEFCHLLEGVIELTEAGCPPRIFRKGDSFVMKPGYRGVWKTIETVRKIYVIVG
jgi:uncharacterized cupin superfamily protein